MACWYENTSQTTSVAVPGMMPSEGPTAYVLPLSHTADTVKCVGCAMTDVKFHPNVIGCDGAILKKDAPPV